VLLPSPAAMLEIMAGAAQESKRQVTAQCPEGRAAGQQPGSAARARGSGAQEPERGLTAEPPRGRASVPEVGSSRWLCLLFFTLTDLLWGRENTGHQSFHPSYRRRLIVHLEHVYSAAPCLQPEDFHGPHTSEPSPLKTAGAS